jgi:hypothetical protein
MDKIKSENFIEELDKHMRKMAIMVEATNDIIVDSMEGKEVDGEFIYLMVNEAEGSYTELIDFLNYFIENTSKFEDGTMENYNKATKFLHCANMGLDLIKYIKKGGSK